MAIINNLITVQNKTVSWSYCGFELEEAHPWAYLLLEGVLLSCIAIFGIFGNILSAIIMSKKTKHSPHYVLLIGLSVCDLTICIVELGIIGLPRLIMSLLGPSYHHFTKFYVLCHVGVYTYPTFSMAFVGAMFFTWSVTIERYIAVVLPYRASTLITYRNVLILAISIALWTVSINILPNFMRGEILARGFPLGQSFPGYFEYGIWIHFTLTSVIPITCIVIQNIIVIYKIYEIIKMRVSFNKTQESKIRKTKMLIIIVITNVMIGFSQAAFMLRPVQDLVVAMDLMATLNSAVNIIIYCVFGKGFRESFFNMFCQGDFHERGNRRKTQYSEDCDGVSKNSTTF